MTPLVDHLVTDLDADGVTMETERVRAGTIIWAAGVLASGLSGALASASGAETDAVGRILVEPDLTLPGAPRGVRDRRHGPDPRRRPAARRRAGGDADGALRGQGRALAAEGVKELGPFKYKDKGNLATIGRARAVADLPPRIRVGGFVAWALWLGIHLFYLIGFQNRLLVLLRWAFSFLTHGRGTRLITGEQNMP